MHHDGATHADSKASAVACVRSVLRSDWQAIEVILRHSPCRVCLVECMAVLGLMFACKQVEPCEHGQLAFDPDEIAEVDAELLSILGQLAGGESA